MKSLLFSIVSLITVQVLSQSSEDLFLIYEGNYEPPEVNASSYERIQQELSENLSGRMDNALDSIAHREFVYSCNYEPDLLNRSGQILFQNKIEDYLNQLKDFLLTDEPRKDKIHVYVTRYTSLNAFTNDFGSIYVNIGAIAKLHNETELLALLAHEIGHVLKEHSIEYERYKRAYESESWDFENNNDQFDRHLFSRSQESAADNFGFELLKKKGVDLVIAKGLFDQMNYSGNPALSGNILPEVFSFGNEFYTTFYDEQLKKITIADSLVQKMEMSDSMSTHPAVPKRLENISAYIEKNEDYTPTYMETGDFDQIQLLSSLILVNSYREKGYYFEGLDLALKLLQKFPDDEFLILSCAKYLTLITQEKYDWNAFHTILNAHQETNDISFLKFKHFLISLNPLEMNVMGLNIVSQMKKRYKFEYLERCENFLFGFLYKHNPGFFQYNGEQIMLVNPDSADFHVLNFSEKLYLTSKKQAVFDSLMGLNFGEVQCRPISESDSLLEHFYTSYIVSSRHNFIVLNVKKKRKAYDLFSLTPGKAFFYLSPDKAVKSTNKEKVSGSKADIEEEETVLVRFLTYYLDGEDSEKYLLNYEKTVKFNTDLEDYYEKKNPFAKDYSNTHINFKSKSDLNKQAFLSIWISERLTFDYFIYSKVDQEIELLKQTKDVRTPVLIMNVTCKNKGKGPKYYNYVYKVYFDLKNEGMCYLVRRASKKKGNLSEFIELNGYE